MVGASYGGGWGEGGGGRGEGEGGRGKGGGGRASFYFELNAWVAFKL